MSASTHENDNVRHRFRGVWAAPAVTAVLLALVWTEPLWSEQPAPDGLTIESGPQLQGAGDSPGPSSDAGFEVDVRVDGADAGEPVTLEMWSDGTWRPDDSGTTDDEGRVHLVASGGAYGRITADVDGSSVTQNFDAITTGPTLTLNDDFDAGLLGPAWVGVSQPTDAGSCSMMGDLARTVAGDQLALTVREDGTQICGDRGLPLVVNGHVALQAPVAYGTVAARIRFPTDRSVSAQFWLQPGDPTQPWVMDRRHEGVVIAETRGTTRDPRLGTSLNRVEAGSVRASSKLLPAEEAPADGRYHVYAVTWTPTGFSFSVDGEVVREERSSTPAPPLSIGLAVLPDQPGRPTGDEDTTMYVDWLRVWAPRS